MPSRGTESSLEVGVVESIARPVVHVAMATFNGRRWIEAQVRSIFRQEDVDVRLVVSDDGSTDGTLEWLQELAQRDPRVTVLPPRQGESGVGENFLYAFVNANPASGEYVAFSDQDDLWRPDKLKRQVALIGELGVDAVSSNVYSFRQTSTGAVEKDLISKDDPQVEWDFVFEAPGAGSSFLLTKRAWELVSKCVDEWGTEQIWLHDWYVYALVRAAGMEWHIDSEPLVAYRQHDQNVLGAHRGIPAVARRMKNLRSGRYRDQFIKVNDAAVGVARKSGHDPRLVAELERLGELLRDRSFKSRLEILKNFRKIRRDPFEGFALGTACLLRVW